MSTGERLNANETETWAANYWTPANTLVNGQQGKLGSSRVVNSRRLIHPRTINGRVERVHCG